MTQRQLAEKAEQTVGSIIKHEQGLYDEPSLRIIVSLTSDILKQDLLIISYKGWIDDKRWNAHLPTTAQYYEGNSRPVGTSPFLHYRTKFLGCATRMELCKLLALHPSIVAEYEAGRTKNMPESIYKALLRAQVNAPLLRILNDLGKDFYARLLESSSQRD